MESRTSKISPSLFNRHQSKTSRPVVACGSLLALTIICIFAIRRLTDVQMYGPTNIRMYGPPDTNEDVSKSAELSEAPDSSGRKVRTGGTGASAGENSGASPDSVGEAVEGITRANKGKDMRGEAEGEEGEEGEEEEEEKGGRKRGGGGANSGGPSVGAIEEIKAEKHAAELKVAEVTAELQAERQKAGEELARVKEELQQEVTRLKLEMESERTRESERIRESEKEVGKKTTAEKKSSKSTSAYTCPEPKRSAQAQEFESRFKNKWGQYSLGCANPVHLSAYLARMWTAPAVNVTLVNIGANKDGLNIYGVEPSPANYELLLKLKDLSGISGVHLLNWASSNISGTAEFPLLPIGSEAGSLNLISDETVKTKSVRVVTVDEMLKELKIKHIHFLVIDTEGFDALVLQGAAKSLKSRKISLVEFEYHWFAPWAHLRLEDTVEMFDRFGYDCFLQVLDDTLVRLTRCFHPNFEFHSWSNVLCVDRREEVLTSFLLGNCRWLH